MTDFAKEPSVNEGNPMILSSSCFYRAILTSVAFAVLASWGSGQEAVTLKDHYRPVFGVGFSPDGRLLATGAWDKTVRVWDLSTHKTLKVLDTRISRGAKAVVFSPDGKFLAAGHEDGISLWATDSWKLHFDFGRSAIVFGEGPRPVYKLAFTSDSEKVVNCHTEHGRKGYRTGVRVWAVHDRQELPHSTEEGGGSLTTMALAKDDCTAATGNTEGQIVLWDVKEQKKFRNWAGHKENRKDYPDEHFCLYDMAFSPDSKVLATAGLEPTLAFWDPATGKQMSVLPTTIKVARCVQYSPDGKLLAVGGNSHTLELWDVASGKLKASLKGHTDKVLCVAFSKDGKQLATGSWDTTVKLWDVEKCLTGK